MLPAYPGRRATGTMRWSFRAPARLSDVSAQFGHLPFFADATRMVSYLKFNVQASVTITGATLTIFANSNHRSGFRVHPVADSTWGETTITYNNAPAVGAAGPTSGALAAGTWVEVPVSSLVATNGTITLALTTTSTTAMSLASRESGANAPQLVLATN